MSTHVVLMVCFAVVTVVGAISSAASLSAKKPGRAVWDAGCAGFSLALFIGEALR
jgi:hypothetical protein